MPTDDQPTGTTSTSAACLWCGAATDAVLVTISSGRIHEACGHCARWLADPLFAAPVTFIHDPRCDCLGCQMVAA